jgi:hypothetical protein
MQYPLRIRWKDIVSILFLSGCVLAMRGFGQQSQPHAGGFSPLPPVGAILAYVGQGELPPGWTVCDGKVIDEAHGFQKDQVDSFWWNRKVPDLNGRFLRGTTEADQVARNGGSDEVTGLKTISDGAHQHDYSVPTKTGRITENESGSDAGGGGYGSAYNVVASSGDYARKHHLPAANGATGNGNHAHYITGGNMQTPVSQGAHQHQIPKFTAIPNYTVVRYIVRVY